MSREEVKFLKDYSGSNEENRLDKQDKLGNLRNYGKCAEVRWVLMKTYTSDEIRRMRADVTR